MKQTLPTRFIAMLLTLLVPLPASAGPGPPNINFILTDDQRDNSFQLASLHGATSIAVKLSQFLGFGDTSHGLAHGWNKPGGAEKLGKWDQWQAENLAYFLGKLSAVDEGNDTLLDNTVVLCGSSNSNTHNNKNYPLILAGGRNLGLKHGEYRQSTPASRSRTFTSLCSTAWASSRRNSPTATAT